MHKNVRRGAHEHLWIIGFERVKVEELIYLLVFVWNLRSEEWPRYVGQV